MGGGMPAMSSPAAPASDSSDRMMLLPYMDDAQAYKSQEEKPLSKNVGGGGQGYPGAARTKAEKTAVEEQGEDTEKRTVLPGAPQPERGRLSLTMDLDTHGWPGNVFTRHGGPGELVLR